MNETCSRYSIRCAASHLGSLCSRCGLLAYRIPFEVVDSEGRPLCIRCARKYALPLYKGLAAYHDHITSETLEYATDDRSYYIRYGSIKSRNAARKSYLPHLGRVAKHAIRYGVTGFYWVHTDNDNATVQGSLNNPDAGESRLKRMIREAFESFEPIQSGLRYLLLTDRYEVPANIDHPPRGGNDIVLPSHSLNITAEMEKAHIGFVGVSKKTGELASIEHQGALVCESEQVLWNAILTWCTHPETFDVRPADFSMMLRFFRRNIPCALDCGSYEAFKDVCGKGKYQVSPAAV